MSSLDLLIEVNKEVQDLHHLIVEHALHLQRLVEICNVDTLPSDVSFQELDTALVEAVVGVLFLEDHTELVSFGDLFLE